ncbi:uncharacterized protein LOC134747255 isoform X3 [Cydia strobilella]|uniref:uncharacterized protein LOC134747255 isoform X3 n=1 Tax=Cydia strobilella TaxID=1100964 RepID=UPI00300505A3
MNRNHIDIYLSFMLACLHYFKFYFTDELSTYFCGVLCFFCSIRKVCLSDKYDKSDSSYNKEPLISNSGGNELEVSRSLFRDGFFPDTLEHSQARFAWTEEDGNIASLVSEPGFGTGQTFGKDLDAALSNEQEADTSSSVFNGRSYLPKTTTDSHLVSSTSAVSNERRGTQGACKVDKTDPRSRFHYVKYVKRHGRTVKLWECGICSREFQHQYTLMRHLPTHTDERNFHCDTCGKSFRQLSTLSQHRAIHSAERPYGCEVCNKTFNRVSTLISHRKTHSDVKPYKCHLCPKGFHQKGNLRNHLFTHTNERPYRCNICFKGFNQQSNLVCHKNKAHSEDANGAILRGRTNTPRAASTVSENQPDSTRTSVDQCEVSSTVGPYMGTSIEVLSSSSWTPKSSPSLGSSDWSNDLPWSTMCNGVIVDPIKTYHMGVALATRQTPFALLKPDNSTPVLVKVIDTKIPGGKQMLVPATADDLRIGGKIVVNNSENTRSQEKGSSDMKSAVQIRVPVVATVVPQIKAGGQLHLAVQEPHHAYHTALSADVGEVSEKHCTIKQEIPPSPPRLLPRMESRMEPRITACMPSHLPPLERHIARSFEDVVKPGNIPSSCSLPPPAPSPPLDLITDLFEPMECIPLGPQITAVDNIDQPPHSDDSDIFIGEFEESIPLSDSD